ncbi:hypothetical protein PR048_023974 [Dryococelus australis]|uniref:Reverse transcriptase RNase H-like domain-containing protein n=1 Tax=Dryococelus australis TaxID=614101 RepID=A0ABQ9GVP5_9NEOP|nr:hypothetical protein PR048_023974 [Dryococelus australis]
MCLGIKAGFVTSLLVQFDPAKPLLLTSDASQTGVGVILSHVGENGDHPIGFVSKTLTAAEKDYLQSDCETLAIIHGVKKFHNYIYGHKFTLKMDHTPLTVILPSSGVHHKWPQRDYNDGWWCCWPMIMKSDTNQG